MDTTLRCRICDWPLAKSQAEGCIEGDCSYRPTPGTDEWKRCQRNRREMISQRQPLSDADLSEISQINRALGVAP